MINPSIGINHFTNRTDSMLLTQENSQCCNGNYPDIALLFAWNHHNEIMQKEKNFIAKGGRFLVYVPTVVEIEMVS